MRRMQMSSMRLNVQWHLLIATPCDLGPLPLGSPVHKGASPTRWHSLTLVKEKLFCRLFFWVLSGFPLPSSHLLTHVSTWGFDECNKAGSFKPQHLPSGSPQNKRVKSPSTSRFSSPTPFAIQLLTTGRDIHNFKQNSLYNEIFWIRPLLEIQQWIDLKLLCKLPSNILKPEWILNLDVHKYNAQV